MNPFQKSPGNSPSPVMSFIKPNSRNPTAIKSWNNTACGTAFGPEMAAQPFLIDSNDDHE